MNLFDISIILIYLSIIFILGIYSRKYIDNFSDFMIAGRNVNLSLSIVTLLGTELGLVTVMYTAQTGVNGLFSSFHIGLAAFLVTLIIGLSGFVIVKLRQLKVKSIPEFYDLRFGKKTRVLGAIILVTGGILNMGLFLKVGAIFIQTIFGLDPDSTLVFVMFILITLVLIYTISGGMISVLITDYIQYIILSLGLLLAVFYSILNLGWTSLFTSLEEIISISGSPRDIYNPINSMGAAYISWQMILGFVSAVIWPTAITRALSIKNPEMVRKQYIWSSISFLFRFIIPCFLGICAFIYFDGNIVANESLSLMPQYLKEILPFGFLGLVVAGMLAAFMSTHDSYLLCWSTIITNDIIEPLYGKSITSDIKIKLTRMIIIFLGIYIFYWGMFYEGSDAIWDYLGITGAIYFTGAISVVVIGLYWERASSVGAVLSLIGGLSSIIGLEPVRNLFGINMVNPAVIGLLCLGISFSLMIIGSIIFPDKENKFSNHKKKFKKQTNLFKKFHFLEISLFILFVFLPISLGPAKSYLSMFFSWKILWQSVFIFSVIAYMIVFLRFTFKGFLGLKEILKK